MSMEAYVNLRRSYLYNMEFIVNIPSSATATPVKQSPTSSSSAPSLDVVVDDLSEQFHQSVTMQSPTVAERTVTSTPVAIRSSPPSVLVTPPPASNLQCSCEGDVCSVCLSPLKANDVVPTEEKSVLETKCKHMFHKKCLLASMLRKCQCPVCRTQLSPMEQLKPLIGDVSMLRVHQLRGAVVEAASRGRNAVRLAWLRRNGMLGSTNDNLPQVPESINQVERVLFNEPSSSSQDGSLQ